MNCIVHMNLFADVQAVQLQSAYLTHLTDRKQLPESRPSRDIEQLLLN